MTFPDNAPGGNCVAVAVKVGSGVFVGGTTVAVSVGSGVFVGVSEVGSGVVVSVGVPLVSGVDVTVSEGLTVGVGDSTGPGVEVTVGIMPPITRLAPVDGRVVRALSPFETRTVHSTEVCPDCKAVTLKVKTAPLVVDRKSVV